MLLTKVAKHSEFTYGVHHDVVAEVAKDNQFTLMQPDEINVALRKLDEGVMGARRSLIGKLCLLRQAIAYGVGYKVEQSNKGPRLVFGVYKRTKDNPETGLQSVLSLGGGGHVEGDDLSYHVFSEDGTAENIQATAAIDVTETLDDSFLREWAEEFRVLNDHGNDMVEALLGNASVKGFNKIGFVMDSKPEHGYVGNTHFGVVYALEYPPEVVRFETKEPQNQAIGWATSEDLLNSAAEIHTHGPFEPWSQFLVENILAIEEHILSTFHGTITLPAITPASIRDTLQEICEDSWVQVSGVSGISADEIEQRMDSLISSGVKEQIGDHLSSFETVTTFNRDYFHLEDADPILAKTVSQVTFETKGYKLTVDHRRIEINVPGTITTEATTLADLAS